MATHNIPYISTGWLNPIYLDKVNALIQAYGEATEKEISILEEQKKILEDNIKALREENENLKLENQALDLSLQMVHDEKKPKTTIDIYNCPLYYLY